jgi:PII-like signaling protein
MKLEGSALRLTVFLGEADCWHRRPLYAEIVHRAHKAGLAGASVFRGLAGFGASSRMHGPKPPSRGQECPVVIVIVDSSANIRAFLPQLDELVAEGAVIVDPVQVIRYAGRPTGTAAGSR